MNVKVKWKCLNLAILLMFIFLCSIAYGCNLNTNYRCENSDVCIPKTYMCNGYADCPNKDDERDCEIQKCKDTKKFFLCRDKKTCVGRELICDNESDCPDSSDESDELCESVAAVSTKLVNLTCDIFHEFKCGNNVCIPIDDVCNGVNNCLDGSDESPDLCKNFQDKYKCSGFLCSNNKCLESHQFVCDGINDCGDGSDEEHCSPSCELANGKFLCASEDECIDVNKACNGVFDCADKSDEGEYCKTVNATDSVCKNFNCKEGSECMILPFGPTCICKKGYERNEKTKECEDINECNIFGTCTQGCVNQIGTFYCTCAKGFFLNEDNKTCDTTSMNAAIIYSTKKYIKKISIGQQSIPFHSIVSKTRQSIGVAYDGESYYWTEIQMAREVIIKYNPSKGTKDVLLTNGLEVPEYLAVDWLTKNIYFTDSTRQHVAVCTNDGYYCTELIKIDIMHRPRAIALHPQDGLLFWTDWGNNSHIGVSFMDGSNPKVLVNDVQWPNGLALDWPNSRIYWIDAQTNSIETVKITGDDRRIILKGIFKHPFALDVFGNQLYWSDHDTKTIEYCDKFTGKNHSILLQGEEVFDVHVYDNSAMPYVKHGCENNPCSHICLLKSYGAYSCACPIGMDLNTDNHNCRFNTKAFIINVGIGKSMYSKVFQSFGRSIENNVKHAVVKIHKMEYNILNGAIFYANNDEHKLYVLDTLGNSHILLDEPNLYITSMSFDYLGNNLYWADSVKETIEVLSLKTKKRAIVHHYTGDYVLSSIVVVPTLGEIFVALVSQKDSQINRVSMKGNSMDDKNFQVIRSELGTGKLYLAVDEVEKKLYWSDTKKKRIEFSSLDGMNRRIFIQSERTPGPLTLVDDYLHWTSEGSKSLQWRRKNGTGPIKLTKLDSMDFLQNKVEFPKVIPIITGNPIKTNNHACAVENGGCSDICISDGPNSKVCLCSIGQVFMDKTQTKCLPRTRCDARCETGECIEASMLCDGKIDCLDRSDEDDKKCKQKKCKTSEFRCDNGECIAKSLWCDLHQNCKDGSDEKNCPKEKSAELCDSRQFQCVKSSECISRTQVCDMSPNCLDYSDETEEICNQKCFDDEFKCLSGQCIPKEFKCNHKIDCYDGSDEDAECSNMCEPPFKPCRDGHCIHERFFCDGVDDCEDSFDELNCSKQNSKIVECDEDEFQCPSKPELCIDRERLCDNVSQCPKGEDERECVRCRPNEFKCLNGHCIDGSLKCDGKSDCKDHSDEYDCKSTPITTCTASNFKCSNGKCIDFERVCDNVNDCDDDEGGQCNESCKNSKCNHFCNPTPKGNVCSCRKGYELKAGSSSECVDIDECDSLTQSPCSQLCRNTKGSFICGCYREFTMSLNGYECNALGDPSRLIYALNNEIRQIDEKKKDFLFEAEYPISSMAVDVRKNILMYSVFGDVGLYVLDLTTKKSTLIDDFPNAILITYDWIAENVYMTVRNIKKMEIHVCSMRTKKCAKIHMLPTNYHITSIDIDPVNNFLFIVRSYQPSRITKLTTDIIRMRLDGSDPKTIFKDSKLFLVKALTVDVRSRTIYFTEQSSQSLMKIDYNGEKTATFIHQSGKLMAPTAIENFENHAYVLDQARQKISICKLYQDNDCSVEINIQSTKHFLIAHISKQIDDKNKCENNGCTDICVNTDYDKKCLCSSSNGEAVFCNESKNVLNSPPDEDVSSSFTFWIIFLILMLITLIVAAAFIYIKKKGFHHNLNISFDRNRGTASMNDFTPCKLPVDDYDGKDPFTGLSRKVTFETVGKSNNNENFNNNEFSQGEFFNKFSNIEMDGMDSDVTSNDDDSDDGQRLIK